MFDDVRRAGLLAAYQATVALGILLMPVALLVGQAGVRLPVDRLVDALGTAYDEARGE
ncbi:MAG: hypothetical protein ABEJ34_03615 [Haloferacaceae archaeon]